MRLADGEQLIHEGPVSDGWVRGWLTLTDRRLLVFNRAKTQTRREIALSDIRGAGRTANVSWVQGGVPVGPLIAMLIRNAIAVRLSDGRTSTFGTMQPDLWADHIRRTCAVGAPAPLEPVSPPYGKAVAVTLAGLLLWSAISVVSSGNLTSLGSNSGGGGLATNAAESVDDPEAGDGLCASDETTQSVKQAIDNAGQVQVLDIGKFSELLRDPADKSTYCLGQVVTTQGQEQQAVARIFVGPSGKTLVEVQESLEEFADKRAVRQYFLARLQNPKTDEEVQLRQLMLAMEQADREANMSPEQRAANEERMRLERKAMTAKAAAEASQMETLSVQPTDEVPEFSPE